MSKCTIYDTECLNDRYCRQHDACCAGDMECQPVPWVATDDSLDDVLDVAAEVLRENADDPGNTRIERLARWVVANLGGEPYTPTQVSELLVDRCLPGFLGDQSLAAAVAYIRLNEGGDE